MSYLKDAEKNTFSRTSGTFPRNQASNVVNISPDDINVLGDNPLMDLFTAWYIRTAALPTEPKYEAS